MVEEEGEKIPAEILAQLDNVAFVAEPGDEDSPLGEYVGVPRVDRSDLDIAPLPDRIVLYHAAFEDECDGDAEKIREEISRTLWHEIAHHLGWDDDRVEEMEKKRGWK